MDIRAIILLGGPAPCREERHLSGCETFADVPFAVLDVLGRPLLQHAVARLRRYGIEEISVVADLPAAASRFNNSALRAGVRWVPASGDELWRAAENLFSDMAHAGAELVVVHRLGAYLELDLERLIQAHLDQRARVTSVEDEEGRLDFMVISAARRNDAAFLLRNRLQRFRMPCLNYRSSEYLLRLHDPRQFRRLAVDALLLRNQIRPRGTELRPGVWMGPGARIAHGARILAPAYVGAYAKVRPAAVLTRCAAIEHHAEVDCGAVVEDSTLLPYCYLGASLDLAQSVAGLRTVFHFARNVGVEIADTKLLDVRSPRAYVRALASAASLLSFVPVQAFRGLFARSQAQPATLPQSVNAPPPSLQSAAPPLAAAGPSPEEFPANLAVVRRYGNE